MLKQEKIDKHFLSIAWLNALNLSKDPMTKVGAVLVSPNGRNISLGYNGMPKGIKETAKKWERPTKYKWSIHAEVNSILNCSFPTEGCTLYCNIQPCHICLGILINSGISRIVYNLDYLQMIPEDKVIWDELIQEFDNVTKIEEDMSLKFR